jgi:hypothetical protein
MYEFLFFGILCLYIGLSILYSAHNDKLKNKLKQERDARLRKIGWL